MNYKYLKIVVFVIIILGYFLIKNTKKNNNTKRNDDAENDYSFGLKEAIEIRKKLEAKEFIEAETLIRKLNSDNLTQTIDYITLTLTEEVLKEWYQIAEDKNISSLFLGVFYNHQAWLTRSHGYAKDVSFEQRLGFEEYQEKSREKLIKVEDALLLIDVEVKVRLIRYYTGNGDLKNAQNQFNKVMALDCDKIWAYINYSEVIQPKWGGNLKLIEDLRETIKKQRKIIQQIVEMKLLLDSFISKENYSGGTMKELKIEAKNTLLKIDEDLSQEPLTSIHKYIVYNYMFAMSEQVGNHKLEIKYFKKMNGYYTLYPFGIIK